MKQLKIILTATCMSASLFTSVAFGYTTGERKMILVNTDVTTHIIMPENLKMVDLSTSKIIGNQCADNMVRIKPASPDSIDGCQFRHNDFLGSITLIGERTMAQYDVFYDANPMNAARMLTVDYNDGFSYINPEISMPESEMARFAWAIYGSRRKFNNIRSNKNGIKASVYNIYTVGDYFFIDFGLENKTNIPYDIAEIKVSLQDKRQAKSTNYQSLELKPVYMLNDAGKFNKTYRQVLVLDKLTFPDEKIITINVSENQISGRTVALNLDYSDVLHADAFDFNKVEQAKNNEKVMYVKDNSGEKQNAKLTKDLHEAVKEIRRLENEVDELNLSLEKMTAAYNGANETIKSILSKGKSKK